MGIIVVPASVSRTGTDGGAYNPRIKNKYYITTSLVMKTLLNGRGQAIGKLRLLQLRTGEDLIDHILVQQEIRNSLLHVSRVKPALLMASWFR